MPTRLLLITGRADVGGGPRHVDALVNHLPADIERWIACPDEPPYGPAWRAHALVRGVARIPARRFSPTALARLIALARREQLQVVYSHGPSGGLYARLLRFFVPQVKVLHAFHGIHVAQYGAITRTGYVAIESALARLTAGFVHVSASEREAALAAGLSSPHRAVIIPNGVAIPHPISTPTPADSSPPLVAMLTRFVYAKQMELAFDIAREAQRAYPSWRFLWAGDGPDRPRLERAVRDAGLTNLTFLGVIPQPGDLLARAHVLLNTSRWEGLPYALLEAGSMGLPVVATRVNGNRDIVSDGVNGYLFDPASPSDGVRALARVLEHPDEAQRLGARARMVIAERFSLDQCIARTAQVVRDVALAS